MLTSASLFAVSNVQSKELEIDSISMFLDFGCMHCKDALENLSPFVESIDSTKLTFSINPILPAKRTRNGLEAEPVVLFFYAAKSIAPNQDLTKLALIIFEGMTEGASLHDFKSIHHWVWMRGYRLDSKKLEEVFYSYRVRMMHEEAVEDFLRAQLEFVPSFVGVRNEVPVHKWRWRSDVAKTVEPVQKLLERNI